MAWRSVKLAWNWSRYVAPGVRRRARALARASAASRSSAVMRHRLRSRGARLVFDLPLEGGGRRNRPRFRRVGVRTYEAEEFAGARSERPLALRPSPSPPPAACKA